MRSISGVVGIAFAFRFVLLVLNSFFITLPESGKDDRRFERLAWEWTDNPPRETDGFAKSGAGLFVKCGTILYQVIGHQPFIWGLILVVMGTACVYNIYKATLLLWGNKVQARRAALIAALYPEFAMLACLTLREVVIHFFLSLAVISLIRYWKYKGKMALFTFLLYTGLATMFHSAMILTLAGFGLAVVVVSQESKKSSFFYKIAAVVIVVGGLLFVNATGIGLSKFGGSLDTAYDKFQSLEESEALGSAAYPSWLRISGGAGDIWKFPIRLMAFLFSPAIPPMVKSASHLVGVIDAIFYMYLCYNYYKNRRSLVANKSANVIFIVLVMLALVFSLGVSNFGTAIRHRAKLLPLFLLLGIDFKALHKAQRRLQQKRLAAQQAQKEQASTLNINNVDIAS